VPLKPDDEKTPPGWIDNSAGQLSDLPEAAEKSLYHAVQDIYRLLHAPEKYTKELADIASPLLMGDMKEYATRPIEPRPQHLFLFNRLQSTYFNKADNSYQADITGIRIEIPYPDNTGPEFPNNRTFSYQPILVTARFLIRPGNAVLIERLQQRFVSAELGRQIIDTDRKEVVLDDTGQYFVMKDRGEPDTAAISEYLKNQPEDPFMAVDARYKPTAWDGSSWPRMTAPADVEIFESFKTYFEDICRAATDNALPGLRDRVSDNILQSAKAWFNRYESDHVASGNKGNFRWVCKVDAPRALHAKGTDGPFFITVPTASARRWGSTGYSASAAQFDALIVRRNGILFLEKLQARPLPSGSNFTDLTQRHFGAAE